MSQVVIGDILPYTQATAIASQTVFGTNWTANAASDVVVYQTPLGELPDDVTDILPYPSRYSVDFIGASQEVQITLVDPASAGDIITITRQTPADRENLYVNTNFTPSMLNNDFGILTLVDQQAQLVNQKIGPRYNYSSTIVNVVDTILPILAANQAWVKAPDNSGFIAYTLPSGGGVAPSNATYVTITDETTALPNSANFSSQSPGLVVFDGSTVITRSIDGVSNEISVTNANGFSGNMTIGIANNAVVPGTAGMGIPAGTTAQRVTPTPPSVGFRYNSDLDSLEFYSTGTWSQINDNTDGIVVTGSINELAWYAANGNAVSGLATINNGVLTTNSSGAPSWLANSVTPGYVLTANNSGPPTWQDASAAGAIKTIAADSGSASPSGGIVKISGGLSGLTTIGSVATINITGVLLSSFGGLGVSNPTAHTIPIAEGVSNFNFLGPLTNGQTLIGSTGIDPVPGLISGAGGIVITPGAGTLAVDGSAYLQKANNLSDLASLVTSRFNLSVDYGYDNTTYINLNTNTTMSNPIVTNTDVSFLSGSLALTLPPMNASNSMGRSGAGRIFSLRNIGGNAFAIKDNGGSSLVASVPTGYVVTFTLVSNGSTAGSFTYQISITNGGVLPLALGGTNKAITASNGGIVFSNATQLDVIAGTSTANQVLLSGNLSQPAWSSATYPATTTANQLLYSSSTNTITGLATANSGVVVTNLTGVPSVLGATADFNMLQSNTSGTPAWSTSKWPATTSASQILYSSSANTVVGLTTQNGGVLVTSNSGVPSILAGSGTTGTVLQATASGSPAWSSATYPLTSTINQLLYSSSANVITGLATTTAGVLTTSSSVPTWLAASATSGVPLISQGASAQPAFGTALVAGGGTGLATTTAYGLITGGTTSTGNFQNAGTGTSGQLYVSGGNAALGTWTTPTYTTALFTQSASVTVANTSAQTTILGAGTGSLTIPANFMVAGRALRIIAWGQLSTTLTPTLTVNVKFGSTTPGNSGAVTTAASVSNAVWKMDMLFTCYTTGSSGTAFLQGMMSYVPTNGAAPLCLNFGNTATTTINTTISNVLNLLITWGTASTSNTITCTNVSVEQLN